MTPDDIRELFSDFGNVGVRRMFGGAGIYADGVMFGLQANGAIYLRTDDSSLADFAREGCSCFTYATKGGERRVLSYWSLPARLYDDPAELSIWAQRALAAAQRAKAQRPARRRKG